MRKWTTKQKITLLKCESDKDLQKHFPKLKVESLRRLQRKFRNGNGKPNGKTKKVVLLPDIHHPHHDVPAWKAVLKFMKWWKPDTVVLLGDAMNMDAVDHWRKEKGDNKFFEGKRLQYDYGLFDEDVLQPIEVLLPNAEKIYMGGNHEDWINGVVNQNPQLEGMIEPEISLELYKRGWKWIPYIYKDKAGNTVRGMHKLGKLTIFHGHYINIYHAKKTAETYSRSTAYGHTHDIQSFAKVHHDDVADFHTSQSIGCLCNLSPSFLKGRPNKWVHGFGALIVRPDGFFNIEVPIIINGKFSVKVEDGTKTFNGNK